MQQFELRVDATHRAAPGVDVPRQREAPHGIVHAPARLGIERVEEFLETRQGIDPGQHEIDRNARAQAGLQLQQAPTHRQHRIGGALGAAAHQPIGIDGEHDAVQRQRGAACAQHVEQGLPRGGLLIGRGAIVGPGVGLRAGIGPTARDGAFHEHPALAQPPCARGVVRFAAQQAQRRACEQGALAGSLGAQYHVPGKGVLREPCAPTADPARARIHLLPLPVHHARAPCAAGRGVAGLRRPQQAVQRIGDRRRHARSAGAGPSARTDVRRIPSRSRRTGPDSRVWDSRAADAAPRASHSARAVHATRRPRCSPGARGSPAADRPGEATAAAAMKPTAPPQRRQPGRDRSRAARFARPAPRCSAADVLCLRNACGQREQQLLPGMRGLEAQRGGHRPHARQVEGQPVRPHASGVQQLQPAAFQGRGVDAQRREAPVQAAQRLAAHVGLAFQVALLLLEQLRPQEQAFTPADLVEPRHDQLLRGFSCRSRCAARARATGCGLAAPGPEAVRHTSARQRAGVRGWRASWLAQGPDTRR